MHAPPVKFKAAQTPAQRAQHRLSLSIPATQLVTSVQRMQTAPEGQTWCLCSNTGTQHPTPTGSFSALTTMLVLETGLRCNGARMHPMQLDWKVHRYGFAILLLVLDTSQPCTIQAILWCIECSDMANALTIVWRNGLLSRVYR